MRLSGRLSSTIFAILFLVLNTVAANMRAPEFELRDQYGNAQAYRFPTAKVNVFIFGDRKGSGQIEAWVRPLYERYQDRINIKGIAALSSVPSLARGMVTRIFKSQVKYPVLLDWTGGVTQSYGYEGGKANVFVVSPKGEILLRINGAATQQGLDQVKTKVSRALGEK
jgi:hypothetical protein